jgi:hypothetical protein
MHRVKFCFSGGLQLTYTLNGTRTAQLWLGQFARMRTAFLLRSDINHRHGFAGTADILDNIVRLQRVATGLGHSLGPIDRQQWQQSLNRLHVHFPEFFTHHFVPEKFQLAHEMNLLVHWLEYELGNVFGGRRQMLFNLDFNHHAPAYNLKAPFPDDEFDRFSADLVFGNLHLHYIYVGRHFLEMFDACDLQCPPHHFRAQQEFNATCGLVFSEPDDAALRTAQMQAFYGQRGGRQFFGFDFDDPKLARGFFKIGQLENLSDFTTVSARQALRNSLKDSHVVNWVLL